MTIGDVKEHFFESEIVRERKKIPRGTLSRANSLTLLLSYPLLFTTHSHTIQTMSGSGKIEKVKKGGAGKGNWGKPGEQEGCGVYLDKGDPMYPDDE